MSSTIQRIVIIGPAETAAAACAFAISLRGSGLDIVFVETPDDDAAAPFVLSRGGAHGYHQLLGLDEANIIANAGGGYVLGARFCGFLDSDCDITVPQGNHGNPLRLVDFHQYVAKLHAAGNDITFNDFSVPAAAAGGGSFDPGQAASDQAAQTIGYDLCLHRKRYAAHMRRLAADIGVSVVSDVVAAVHVDDGLVTSLALESGEAVSGDLFVDASSDRLVVAELASESGFEGWSTWLPCDRTARVSANASGRKDLLATIEANDLGWTNRTRVDDMLVHTYAFASEYLQDDSAPEILATRVGDVEPTDIAVAALRTGRYSEHWLGNCIALGPAVATLEPMEVSPLHLLQSGVLRLLAMLPREKLSPNLAAEFNRATNAELDDIRDYQLLRYALASRTQGAFWERVATREWPESLQRRIGLFTTHGRLTRGEPALISKAQWISSFVNFGAKARSYDPVADMIDADRMRADIDEFRAKVAATVSRMREHRG